MLFQDLFFFVFFFSVGFDKLKEPCNLWEVASRCCENRIRWVLPSPGCMAKAGCREERRNHEAEPQSRWFLPILCSHVGLCFFGGQSEFFFVFFVPGVVPSEELAMVLASAEIDMTRTELWEFCLDSTRMVQSCNGQLRESYAESLVNCALVNLASRMQIDALVEAVDTKAPWQSDESQGNSCHAFCSFFQNHRFTGIFAIKRKGAKVGKGTSDFFGVGLGGFPFIGGWYHLHHLLCLLGT